MHKSITTALVYQCKRIYAYAAYVSFSVGSIVIMQSVTKNWVQYYTELKANSIKTGRKTCFSGWNHFLAFSASNSKLWNLFIELAMYFLFLNHTLLRNCWFFRRICEKSVWCICLFSVKCFRDGSAKNVFLIDLIIICTCLQLPYHNMYLFTSIPLHWFCVMQTLYSIADKVKNFAVIYVVDISEVQDFSKMYELYDPCTTMFFYRYCDFYVILFELFSE